MLTCLLPFLTTKGSRVLEKKVNEIEVSKTVFSHLKLMVLILDLDKKIVHKDIHLNKNVLKVQPYLRGSQWD